MSGFPNPTCAGRGKKKIGFVPAIKAPQKYPMDEVLQALWITELGLADVDKLGFARLGFRFLGFVLGLSTLQRNGNCDSEFCLAPKFADRNFCLPDKREGGKNSKK